jgi:hypothetical protein
VFDPLSNIETLLDRVLMMEAIQKCSNTCSVGEFYHSVWIARLSKTYVILLIILPVGNTSSPSQTSLDFRYKVLQLWLPPCRVRGYSKHQRGAGCQELSVSTDLQIKDSSGSTGT